MIHEIQPHIYDNSFHQYTPGMQDIALYYEGKEMLLAGDGEAGHIQLPRFSQLDKTAMEQAEYLFSIDTIGCYLLWKRPEVKNGEALTMRPVQLMREAEQWIGFAGVTGWQLQRWEQTHKFCGKCGALMRRSARERAFVCPQCGIREYPKINPAIIVAVSDGDELLMIKSPGSTSERYHLIAGYVEVGETFEQTVAREVMEEVGVKVKNIRYYKSQPWAFSDTIMVGFTAELDGERTPFVLQEEEIAEAKWVHRKDILQNTNQASIGSDLIRYFIEQGTEGNQEN